MSSRLESTRIERNLTLLSKIKNSATKILRFAMDLARHFDISKSGCRCASKMLSKTKPLQTRADINLWTDSEFYFGR